MFSNCSSESPFTPSRFDAKALPPFVEIEGAGLSSGEKASGEETLEADIAGSGALAQRGGLSTSARRRPFCSPADRMLEQALSAEALPCGMLDRLHAWVDGLPEEPPTGTTAA